jgi:hypothetical protein
MVLSPLIGTPYFSGGLSLMTFFLDFLLSLPLAALLRVVAFDLFAMMTSGFNII